jgi:putative endonuclease
MSETAAAHLVLGRKGEDAAARYLATEEGLVVLSRNWRCREGELDLVLTDGSILVVCEVKTRTSTRFGPPAEAITDAKANRIRRLARRWQHTYNTRFCPVRFDLVSIVWPPGEPAIIDHVPAAF